jgi:HEAT repeat protein
MRIFVACLLVCLALAGCGRQRRPNASAADERVFAKLRVAEAGPGPATRHHEEEIVPEAELGRRAAVRELVRVFEKATSPDDRLDPLDRIVRTNLRAPELIPYVARCLTDPDPDQRIYGVKARAVISPETALPDIQLVLRESKEPKVRQAAIEAIGLLPDPLPFDAVFAHLGGELDPLVQQAAMLLVASRGKEGQVPRVLAIVKDLDPKAVSPVIDLFRKHPEATRPQAEQLAYFLDRNDPDLRMQVAKFLGELGTRTPAVISGLVRALNDPEIAVRRAALTALKTYSSRDFGYDPDASPEARKEAFNLWRAWARQATGDGKQSGDQPESQPESR